MHISELSWSHVNHPSEVVKVGDPVNVQVLDVDLSRERISLGLKQTTDDPWKQLVKNFPIGSIIEGKVTKLVPFGVFVELGDGVEGLVHISEMAKGHVETPDQVAKVGDKVHVKVMDVDEERRRISLSMRAAAETLGFEIEIAGLPEGAEESDEDEMDADGVVVVIDEDGDGDADAVIVAADTDDDGEIDTVVAAVDSDGDGDVDTVVTAMDVDGDGEVDEVVTMIDTDGDGVIDTVIEEVDVDGDGEPDVIMTTLDVDGDGNPDIIEIAEPVDTDGDGVDDAMLVTTAADVDGDGEVDVVNISAVVDTDGDGEPDTVVEIATEIVEDEPVAEEEAPADEAEEKDAE